MNMLKKFAYIAAFGLTSAMVLSCANNNDSSTSEKKEAVAGDQPAEAEAKVGYFVDSAVAGVDYKSASKSGTTDKEGKFKYFSGKDVAFSLGGVEIAKFQVPAETELGKAGADKILSPADIFVEDGEQITDAVENFARFVQTLDADGDPSNGINLEHVKDAPAEINKIDFNVDPDEFAQNEEVTRVVVKAALQTDNPKKNKRLITAKESRTHLFSTIVANKHAVAAEQFKGFTLSSTVDVQGFTLAATYVPANNGCFTIEDTANAKGKFATASKLAVGKCSTLVTATYTNAAIDSIKKTYPITLSIKPAKSVEPNADVTAKATAPKSVAVANGVITITNADKPKPTGADAPGYYECQLEGGESWFDCQSNDVVKDLAEIKDKELSVRTKATKAYLASDAAKSAKITVAKQALPKMDKPNAIADDNIDKVARELSFSMVTGAKYECTKAGSSATADKIEDCTAPYNFGDAQVQANQLGVRVKASEGKYLASDWVVYAKQIDKKETKVTEDDGYTAPSKISVGDDGKITFDGQKSGYTYEYSTDGGLTWKTYTKDSSSHDDYIAAGNLCLKVSSSGKISDIQCSNTAHKGAKVADATKAESVTVTSTGLTISTADILASAKTATGMSALVNPTVSKVEKNSTPGTGDDGYLVASSAITFDHAKLTDANTAIVDVTLSSKKHRDSKVTITYTIKVVAAGDPVIESATYDASTGKLVITGQDLATATDGWDITKLKVQGKGSDVTLAAGSGDNTTTIGADSATKATVTFKGTAKTAIDAVLDTNGTKSSDDTTYNLAAAAGFIEAKTAVADATDNAITVSGVKDTTKPTAELADVSPRFSGNGRKVVVEFSEVIDTSITEVSNLIAELSVDGTAGSSAGTKLTAKKIAWSAKNDQTQLTITLPNQTALVAGKYVFVKFQANVIKDKAATPNKMASQIVSKKIATAGGQAPASDTTAPKADSSNPVVFADNDSDSAYNADDTITLKFDEPVVLDGWSSSNKAASTFFAIAQGSAASGTPNLGASTIDSKTGSGAADDEWVITLVNSGGLADIKAGNTLTPKSGKVKDAAGNAANHTGNDAKFTLPASDKTAPKADSSNPVVFTDTNTDSAYNANDTITLKFDETVALDGWSSSNKTASTFFAIVKGTAASGTPNLGNSTIDSKTGSGAADDEWVITLVSGGSLADIKAGNALTPKQNKVKDVAGNAASHTGTDAKFTLPNPDSTAPASPAIKVGSQTGTALIKAAGDNFTITGTDTVGVTAYYAISVATGGTKPPAPAKDASKSSGNSGWVSVTSATNLNKTDVDLSGHTGLLPSAGASKDLYLFLKDAAGNVSVASSKLAVTFDNTKPVISSIAIAGKTSANTAYKIEVGDKITITFPEAIDVDFDGDVGGTAEADYYITYTQTSGLFTIYHGTSATNGNEIATFKGATGYSDANESFTVTAGSFNSDKKILTLPIASVVGGGVGTLATLSGSDTFSAAKIKSGVYDSAGNQATDDAAATNSTPNGNF